MATRILAPGGAPTHPQGAGPAPITYTPEQLRLMLADIAGKAGTLRNVLTYIAEEVKDHRLSNQLDATVMLADMIGAAADLAQGGDIKGGFEEWMYGSDFWKAGAA